MLIIDGKDIYYNDKISGVQKLWPEPSEKALKIGGKPTKEEIEAYNKHNGSEEELAIFCINDAKKAGGTLIKTDKGDKK